MGMHLLDEIHANAELVIRESIAADVPDLAPRLRIPDMAEIAAATGERPITALGRGFAASTPCYTALYRGKVVAMFGVVPEPTNEGAEFPRVGHIWMLGSDDIPLFRKSFMRHTKPWLAVVCDGYDMVTNLVDARNTRHIAWIKRSGFTFTQLVTRGKLNLPFLEFVKVV